VVTASAEILSQGQDGQFAIRTREEFAAIVQRSYIYQPQLEILRKQEEAREQLEAEFGLGMQMLKLEYENVIRDRRDVPGWPRPPEKSKGAETKSKSSEDDEFLKRCEEKLGLEEKKLRLKLAKGLRDLKAKHRMKASTMQEFVDEAYDKSAVAMYDAILGTMAPEALTAKDLRGLVGHFRERRMRMDAIVGQVPQAAEHMLDVLGHLPRTSEVNVVSSEYWQMEYKKVKQSDVEEMLDKLEQVPTEPIQWSFESKEPAKAQAQGSGKWGKGPVEGGGRYKEASARAARSSHTEPSGLTCHNSGQKGHVLRECTQVGPTFYRCGRTGT
jgi:hypothetical protein